MSGPPRSDAAVVRAARVADPPVRPLPQQWRAGWTGLLVVVAGALIVGGISSPAQGLLPDALSSAANSASGWSAAVAILVFATRQRALLAAALYGVAGFEACNLGYQIVSNLRGHPYTGEFWAVVALLAGPVIGIAASWLHRRDLLGALGAAVLAAVGLGDGINGVLFIPTTSPVYWVLIGSAAIALVLVMCIRRLRSSMARVVACVGAAVGSALYCVALSIVF